MSTDWTKDIRFERPLKLVFFAVLLWLYLAFPSKNLSGDSWGYAGDIKFGQNLFYPHHLLFTATAYLWKEMLYFFFPGSSAIWATFLLNGFAAWTSMLTLSGILRKLGKIGIANIALTAIAAFSFGFWRYACEVEVYILPVLFSLISFYLYVKAIDERKPAYEFFAGLLAAIACLYHQIHIFWWMAQAIGILWILDKKRGRFLLLYILPILIVPSTYMLVISLYFHETLSINSVMHFALHDVYAGEAGYLIGRQHFILGAVNTVRTFYQIHGIVPFLLKANFLYYIPLGIAAMLLGLTFYHLMKKYRSVAIANKPVFKVLLLIFILQWLFAVYNVGNAEFMVMVPPVAALALGCLRNIGAVIQLFFAASLLIWNLFFGIQPNSQMTLSAEERIIDRNLNALVRGPVVLIMSQHALARNIFYYKEGRNTRFILAPPSKYVEKYGNADSLRQILDSCFQWSIPVFTDCKGRPQLMSRASLLYFEADNKFFSRYQLLPADSFRTSVGMHFVFRVKLIDSQEHSTK